MRLATNVKRADLLSVGTCVAKITHSGKVHLQVTCLDHLAKHALHKVRPGAARGRPGAARATGATIARARAPRGRGRRLRGRGRVAPARRRQVWLKPSAEMAFLYGNNARRRAGVGRGLPGGRGARAGPSEPRRAGQQGGPRAHHGRGAAVRGRRRASPRAAPRRRRRAHAPRAGAQPRRDAPGLRRPRAADGGVQGPRADGERRPPPGGRRRVPPP